MAYLKQLGQQKLLLFAHYWMLVRWMLTVQVLRFIFTAISHSRTTARPGAEVVSGGRPQDARCFPFSFFFFAKRLFIYALCLSLSSFPSLFLSLKSVCVCLYVVFMLLLGAERKAFPSSTIDAAVFMIALGHSNFRFRLATSMPLVCWRVFLFHPVLPLPPLSLSLCRFLQLLRAFSCFRSKTSRTRCPAAAT